MTIRKRNMHIKSCEHMPIEMWLARIRALWSTSETSQGTQDKEACSHCGAMFPTGRSCQAREKFHKRRLLIAGYEASDMKRRSITTCLSDAKLSQHFSLQPPLGDREPRRAAARAMTAETDDFQWGAMPSPS